MKQGTHIFPYIKLGPYHRPIIPITLRFRGITIEYHALIDSGADFNLFPADLAVIFGIQLERSNAEHISGIGGEAIAYPYIFDIGVDQHLLFRAPVLLSPDIALNYGIVGQAGFFDQFIVEFTYQTKQIALTALNREERVIIE